MSSTRQKLNPETVKLAKEGPDHYAWAIQCKNDRGFHLLNGVPRLFENETMARLHFDRGYGTTINHCDEVVQVGITRI